LKAGFIVYSIKKILIGFSSLKLHQSPIKIHLAQPFSIRLTRFSAVIASPS